MDRLPYWRDLAVETVLTPATAAARVLQLDLSQQVLWMALFLVAVLNTILFKITNLAVPGPSPLPPAFDSPLITLLVVAGGLVLTVHALFWTGRAMGGTGRLGDVLVLMIWLQVLRLVVQGATLILVLTIPALAVLLVFATAILGLWILIHFINAAHHFDSLPLSAGVLVATLVGLTLGLSVILFLIGATILGSSAYV
jgi:hypothetical protein